MTKRYTVALVRHLQHVDPRDERKTATALQRDHKVELARALEARARLRGSLLHHGG